jgi:acetyltransferase-like isoleucine patch superfamily enzyme
MSLKNLFLTIYQKITEEHLTIGEWNGGATIIFHGPKINVEVGKYSYGTIHVYSYQPFGKIKIGNYTSISKITIVTGGNHHMGISTYPMKTVFMKEPVYRDNIPPREISIGSDVWIGYGATILDGVKIGNGAVIGANALIAKDVPDYAIVVGNPSNIIRYRFEKETVEKFLNLKWWDLNEEEIEDLIPLFYSNDLDNFIASIGKIKRINKE